MDYLTIFRELEVVCSSQSALLHNAVKSPVGDLQRALTRLLLYNEESRFLVGQENIPAGGGTSSDSTSGESDSTLPLGGQRVTVGTMLAIGDDPLAKLLSKKYSETIKTADPKAASQLELMTMRKFLSIVLESWNEVLKKTELATSWTPLYKEIISGGATGKTWDAFELIARFKNEISPSIGELTKMRSNFLNQKQGNLSVPLYAGKLKAMQEDNNGILSLFDFNDWKIGRKDCLYVLLMGLNQESRNYVQNTIIPSMCTKENLAPGKVSFDLLLKEFPNYSFEHLSHSTSSVNVNAMTQRSQQKKKPQSYQKGMPTGTDGSTFMRWAKAHPQQCYFCLGSGHRYGSCPTPPDKNRKYPADHPLHGKGMSDAMVAALSKATKTINISRMSLKQSVSDKVIHDTGCEGITVIGGSSVGIDSRNSSRSLVHFKFGGGPGLTSNALVGMLYLRIGGRVMRTPAVFNDELCGIYLSNKSCPLDGGIVVKSTRNSEFFYELEIPTFSGKEVQRICVGVDKESSKLCSDVERLTQEEIERVEKVALNLNILGDLKCAIAPMENFQLPGRPVGLYPPTAEDDVEVNEIEEDEEILHTDEECEDDDLGKLNELHMRCNHRAPEDIKRMIKEGQLDFPWTNDMEEELKNFHCEACAAVRLKNQKRGKRRKSPKASRPLQIIHMDTIPCPSSIDENDDMQKLLLRLPPRSTPSIPPYTQMLLLVDEFTRMKWALPLYSKSAEDVARGLDKWVSEDVPLISSRILRSDASFDRTVENLIVELNSDYGTEFSTVGNVQSSTDNAFLELCKRLKVAHHVSMPDQQWQNGVVEGQVGVLKENAIISLRVAQAEAAYFPMAFM